MSDTHDAMLWEKLDGEKVRCDLCGHRCEISAGKYGICRVRENVAGELRTHSFGPLVALNPDPIEKKPLFHFLPGTRSMSIATAGCNFRCEFCQNWQISQSPRERPGVQSGQAVRPEQIVAAARQYDCASISYTYTEPTVFFELAYETARIAHGEGLGNCFVSNGYLTPLAIEEIAPYLDAINVDLKAFRDETYQHIMKARLQPVLDSLKTLVEAGIWVEVTTLVVPGMNDSPEELGDIASFIGTELGPDVPWHVSRFHADYRMTDGISTPLATLQLACAKGREAGLRYIYCGNVHGQADERTYCPACGTVVIDRMGYTVRAIRIKENACPECGQAVSGVFELPRER